MRYYHFVDESPERERRPHPERLLEPHAGWRLCPECGGERFCQVCDGQAWRSEEQGCRMCSGTAECYFCGGGRPRPPVDLLGGVAALFEPERSPWPRCAHPGGCRGGGRQRPLRGQKAAQSDRANGIAGRRTDRARPLIERQTSPPKAPFTSEARGRGGCRRGRSASNRDRPPCPSTIGGAEQLPPRRRVATVAVPGVGWIDADGQPALGRDHLDAVQLRHG